MAGGGKLYSLVLLMALLALFTTTYAARSHLTMQSLNRELVRSFGVSGAYEPCCFCACTRKYPPEANTCMCGGVWEGTCPSVCKNCQCDDNNQCSCQETIKYNDCVANECPFKAAGEGAHEGK